MRDSKHRPEWELARPATVTLEEVAYALQVSVRTVRRRVKDKTIPARKVGVFWRVPEAFLTELRNGVGADLPEELRETNEPQEALPARHTYTH